MPLKIVKRADSPILQIAGTVAGQRVRESAGTADPGLAEEKRAILEAALYRRSVHGNAPQALTSWAEACRSYSRVEKPSAGTARLLLRLSEHFGGTLLSEIHQVALDRAAATLCRADAAPATILRNVVVPVQAVLNHAARRGWCAPPMLEKPKGSAGVKRTRWLTPDEYARLRDAAGPHLRPLIVFLACTGARIGEALALDWKDVDLRHGRALLRDTKNGRDRLAELPPAAVAALAGAAYPALNRHGRPRHDAHGRRIMEEAREGRVFRTDDGAAYPEGEDSGGQVKTAWAGACRRAGLPGAWKGRAPGAKKGGWWAPQDVTPHVLRHSWASWHYCLHRDLLRLRTDGGWDSASQVERYAKLAPPTMAAEIRKAWGLGARAAMERAQG